MTIMNKIAPHVCAMALGLASMLPSALADSSSRNYSVSAASVMDNCGKDGIQLSSERAMISESGSGVRVSISGLPDLIGLSDKRGKLRLSAKQSKSRISAKVASREIACSLC